MISRLLAAVTISVAAGVWPASPGDAATSWVDGIVSAPPSTDPGSDQPAATALDNPYLPESANLGDCVSALPRPECGSGARGGWRQTAVFVVLVGALVAIGIRVAVGLRQRARRAG